MFQLENPWPSRWDSHCMDSYSKILGMILNPWSKMIQKMEKRSQFMDWTTPWIITYCCIFVWKVTLQLPDMYIVTFLIKKKLHPGRSRNKFHQRLPQDLEHVIDPNLRHRVMTPSFRDLPGLDLNTQGLGPGCAGYYIEDERLPSYIGIKIINQYNIRIPIKEAV